MEAANGEKFIKMQSPEMIRVKQTSQQQPQSNQMPQTPKQNNNYPKLQYNTIGQQDTSYFINSNANVVCPKYNYLMHTSRCPSPEERLKFQLFDQTYNLMNEQSIKRYTRRKSCKGGCIFGEYSKQNILREKQFPLSIINMHLKRIIIEATKKRNNVEKQNISQNKRNQLSSTPKQPSFKNQTGKSLFNQTQTQVFSPLIVQNTTPIFNSMTSSFISGGYSQSQTQNPQRNLLSPQNPMEIKQQRAKTPQNNDTSYQNKLNEPQKNPKKLFYSNTLINNNINQKQTRRSFVQTNDLDEQQKLDDNSNKCNLFITHQSNNQFISKIIIEDINEPSSIIELKSINSIRMEIEEKKKSEIIDDIDGNPIDFHLKNRPSQIITMNLFKQSDRESIYSESQSDIENENDSSFFIENQKTNQYKQNKDFTRKNGQIKTECHKQQTSQKNDAISEQDVIKTESKQNQTYSPGMFQKNQPRFSIINIVESPISLENARKNQFLIRRQSEDQLGNFQDERSLKVNSLPQRKPSKMQNQALQEILQEYIQPGSIDNELLSPVNPISRAGNMKKMFISATNMIALQNRVKANNTFYRNYYNLIGKVSVDNNTQYLSQMAEEILSIPSHRKMKTVICAPLKRKVFIRNTQEDKVKMVSQLNKQRINQTVQKYVIEKQATMESSFVNTPKGSLSRNQSMNTSKFSQQDYLIRSQDNSNKNNRNKSYSAGFDYITSNNSTSVNRRLKDLQEIENNKQKKMDVGSPQTKNKILFNLLNNPYTNKPSLQNNFFTKCDSPHNKMNSISQQSSNRQIQTPYYTTMSNSSYISQNKAKKCIINQNFPSSKKQTQTCKPITNNNSNIFSSPTNQMNKIKDNNSSQINS